MEPIVKHINVKSVLTKSNLPVSDYSVNPYIGCAHQCKYCYASFMKRFSKHREPWGEFVDIKHWPDIKNPKKYAGKELFIGSVTDPYQPLEEVYGRTRELLRQLQGSGCKISIATKSDLLLRDLDLLQSFPDVRISWSINTLDESFREDMDQAVSIDRRFAAMQACHDAGIRTTCFISPIFPGITDVESIIRKARKHCNLIWLENLNLRGEYKKVILNYIAERYPDLSALYEQIYQKKDRRYWVALDQRLQAFTTQEKLRYVRNDDSVQHPFSAPPVVVNYFFHEEITRQTKQKKQ